MKKLLILLITFSFFNCVDNTQNNDTLPFITVNETVDLNLPQNIDLLVPGGWAYASGGISGIIVYNLNGNQFKAFERSCPHLSPSSCSQMIVQNSIKIVCPCDDAEFNILNGAPLTSGVTNFAREYLVTNLNGTVLRITNF
jgi:nitrite reductase/ring-hydroxylating ferredoxin subunit